MDYKAELYLMVLRYPVFVSGLDWLTGIFVPNWQACVVSSHHDREFGIRDKFIVENFANSSLTN